jgi:hypothetical protein
MSRMLLIKMTPPLHNATLQVLKPVCQKNQVSALGRQLILDRMKTRCMDMLLKGDMR